MKRRYCDRCDADLTEAPRVSSIAGVADADDEGDGQATDVFDDVCASCYALFLTFMEGVPLDLAIRPNTTRSADLLKSPDSPVSEPS